jgi:hypothetical protein
MKRILGRRHRPLVTKAKRSTQREFIAALTEAQVQAIRRRLQLGAKEFWRAVRGKVLLGLPGPERQLEFDFDGHEGAVGSKA